MSADRFLARLEAAAARRGEQLAEASASRLTRVPSVDPRVRWPHTTYRPSAVHDCVLVTYRPRGGRASWGEFMAPGTHEGD